MNKLLEFCKKFNVRVVIENDHFIPAVNVTVTDPKTEMRYRETITHDLIEHALIDMEDYIIDKIEKEMGLEEDQEDGD